MEPGPPALGEQSLNHWTTREVLAHLCQEAPFLGQPASVIRSPTPGVVRCLVSEPQEQTLSLMGTRRPDEQAQCQQPVSPGSAWGLAGRGQDRQPSVDCVRPSKACDPHPRDGNLPWTVLGIAGWEGSGPRPREGSGSLRTGRSGPTGPWASPRRVQTH